MIAKFIVEGLPVPKGRPRVFRHMTITPKKTKEHEFLIAECFKLRCPHWNITDKKVFVSVEFHFKPAKSTPKKRLLTLLGEFCDNHKDIDNLIKTVLDGLNNIAYLDDKQVVKICASKHWSNENFTKVEIEEIETQAD